MYGASVLLRIDDLDRDRVRPHYLQDIFITLHYMGIKWQQGPLNADEFDSEYSQLKRLTLYENYLATLRQLNLLYACNCSRSQLSAGSNKGWCKCDNKQIHLDEPGVAWRLNTIKLSAIELNTLKQGKVKVDLPSSLQNMVVRKKDGQASYQIASLADDVYFKVDLVVRGADLWDSSVAQLYLAQLLDLNSFLNTTFHHHSLITNLQGQKLSKSAGDTSVKHLIQEGLTAKQIFAKLAEAIGRDEDSLLLNHLSGIK